MSRPELNHITFELKSQLQLNPPLQMCYYLFIPISKIIFTYFSIDYAQSNYYYSSNLFVEFIALKLLDKY